MHLLLLLMALLVQVHQAWILPASSPLRAAPRSNTPAVTTAIVAGSLGEGDAGTDGSVVKTRLSKPIGLMLAEKEIGKPGLRVDDMVEGGSAEVGFEKYKFCVTLSRCCCDLLVKNRQAQQPAVTLPCSSTHECSKITGEHEYIPLRAR